MLPALLMLLVPVLVYGPVLRDVFGYNDDYRILRMVQARTFTPLHNEMITQGRPLLGVGVWAVFGRLDGIAGLRVPRGVALAGAALFSWALYRVLRRAGTPGEVAATSALLVTLSPGMAVYVGWACLLMVPVGGALACGAGACIWHAWDGARRRRGLVAGAALLLASLLIYQPLSGLTACVLGVMALQRQGDPAGRLRTFAAAVAVFLAVCAAYMALFKVATVLWVAEVGQPARAEVSGFSPAKLQYAAELLWGAGTSWWRFGGVGVASVAFGVACALLLAPLVLARDGRRAWASRALCVVATLPLCVLPILAVRENDFAYRTQFALHVFVLCGVVQGLHATVVHFIRWPGVARWVFRAAAAALVVAMGLQAHRRTLEGIVLPNVAELAALRAALSPLSEPAPRELVFVSPRSLKQEPWIQGEFGVIASSSWWNTDSLLQLLLLERAGLALTAETAAVVPEVVVAPGDAQPRPVVDAFGAWHGIHTAEPDAYWGPLRRAPDGWCASPWFGTFEDRGFPMIGHVILGRLVCAGRGAARGDYRFRHASWGWFWTSPAHYPICWFERDRQWKWIPQTLTPPFAVVPLAIPQ